MAAREHAATTRTDRDTLEGAVIASLQQVADPCCRDRGISVLDMGLLERLDIDEDGRVRIDLVLTSGWCPFQVDLLSEVAAAAEAVAGVRDADVRITLDEVWSRARLSPFALDRLRLLPEPGEVRDRDAYLSRHPASPDRRTQDDR